MVEAARRSGSLITARLAGDAGSRGFRDTRALSIIRCRVVVISSFARAPNSLRRPRTSWPNSHPCRRICYKVLWNQQRTTAKPPKYDDGDYACLLRKFIGFDPDQRRRTGRKFRFDDRPGFLHASDPGASREKSKLTFRWSLLATGADRHWTTLLDQERQGAAPGMKENVLDVLMYLFETYVDTDEEPEADQNELRDELSRAGFTATLEIDRALDWLDGLTDHQDKHRLSRPDLPRPACLQRLRTGTAGYAACRGYIAYLEQIGILSPQQREILIDRLLALESTDIDVDQIKWVVLMVLIQPAGTRACVRQDGRPRVRREHRFHPLVAHRVALPREAGSVHISLTRRRLPLYSTAALSAVCPLLSPLCPRISSVVESPAKPKGKRSASTSARTSTSLRRTGTCATSSEGRCRRPG